MDRGKIAKQLVYIAKDILASSKQGFNLPRKSEKIIRLMKDNGFILREDGGVSQYVFTPLGFFDFTKPPINVARDIDAAVRKDGHIKDSIVSYIERYRSLLEALARLNQRMDNPKSIQQFDKDVSIYINKRVRKPELVRVNEDLLGMRFDLQDSDYYSATKKYRVIDDLVSSMMEVWQRQLSSIEKRRRAMLAIRKKIEHFPGFLRQLQGV